MNIALDIIRSIKDPFRVQRTITGKFRRARMIEFERMFGVTDATRIIDIGGGAYIWGFLRSKPNVVCVNLEIVHSDMREGIALEVGDGRALSYPDKHFDIAFSNSLIEHVGDYEDMRRLANEIRRVAKSYYVQTPNFWFPIDPHTYGFANHWFPQKWQRPAIRYTSGWSYIASPSEADINEYLSNTRMITVRKMREFFPEATIIRERFCGLTKSIIAVSINR